MNTANNSQPVLQNITNTINQPSGTAPRRHQRLSSFFQGHALQRRNSSPSLNPISAGQQSSIYSRNITSAQQPPGTMMVEKICDYHVCPQVGEKQFHTSSEGKGKLWLVTDVQLVEKIGSWINRDRDLFKFRIELKFLEDIEYEPPTNRQSPRKSVATHQRKRTQDKSHKHRLLLGEADFSFANALTEKHPKVAAGLTATAYENEAYLYNTYSQTGPANKKRLLQRGARVLHEVDATQLNEDQRLRGDQYDGIYFNFPHDGKSYRDSQTSEIIDGFLKSSRRKLPKDGRVHMALVSRDKNGGEPAFYHGVLYKIADKTLKNGFKLVKKRKFDGERYPSYAHQLTTRGGESLEHVKKYGREYIFEKIDSDDEEELIANRKRFRSLPGEGAKKYLPEVDTDYESSDYDSSQSQ